MQRKYNFFKLLVGVANLILLSTRCLLTTSSDAYKLAIEMLLPFYLDIAGLVVTLC